MASTPESRVKKKVVETLKELGAYYFYPVTGGYGKSGVFDIVACYKGMFIGIECKAGKGKPTMLQSRNATHTKAAGGIVLLINENNIADVKVAAGWIDEQSIRPDKPCIWPFDSVEVS